MMTSMPSPRTLRSKSVTRAATSISASAPMSRPVISQSIHTSLSLTSGHPTHLRADALSLDSVSSPRFGDVKDWIGLVARLITGGVWLVAGGLKLLHPAESVRAVRAYDLLPEAIVPAVGHLLPVVEVVIGLCLILGVLTRSARGGLGAAVCRLHHRHLLGAWAPRPLDRLRLLRRRRGDPRRGREVPRRDRPRRRPARPQPLAGGAPAVPARPGHRPLPPTPDHDPTTTDRRRRRKPRWRRRRPRTGPRRRRPPPRPSVRPAPGADRAGADRSRGAPQGRQAQRAAHPRRTGRRRARARSSAATSSCPAWAPTSRTRPPAGASGDYGMVVGEADAPEVRRDLRGLPLPLLRPAREDRAATSSTRRVEAGEVKVEYRPLAFLERIDDYSPRVRQRVRRRARRVGSRGRQGVPRPPLRRPAVGGRTLPRRRRPRRPGRRGRRDRGRRTSRHRGHGLRGLGRRSRRGGVEGGA